MIAIEREKNIICSLIFTHPSVHTIRNTYCLVNEYAIFDK